jgi:hypothetical protein
MLNGFLCSIAVALSLLIAAAGGDEIIVETSNATIESRQGQRLRVVFAAEDRPALIFKPEAAPGTGLRRAGSSSRWKTPPTKC